MSEVQQALPDMATLSRLIGVKAVAEMKDVPTRVVRKEAKAGNIDGAIQVLGKWGFDPEKIGTWNPPEAGTRVATTTREDGRRSHRIFLTDEERTNLSAQGFEIIDPRIAAKARRDARKAAKAAKAAAGPAAEADIATEAADPFATFGG